MLRGLLVRVRPTDQITIPPWPRRNLQTERQTAWIKPARNHDRRNPDHVHPTCRAVWTFAELAILRHGFIRRRHLRRGIYIAVQVQTVQRRNVNLERLPTRT